MAEDWMTVQDAARFSRYHADSIRELVRDGRIKGRKFATVWQVNRASLLAYVKEQEKRGEKRGPKKST